MKNVTSLSDAELLTTTQSLASEERRLSQEVLVHLREIEKRGLHLERGFSSLHEYVVQELHFSDGAASRRINAMRLMTEVKEVSSSIEKGTLNLCTVSTVQTFLRREKKERGKTYSTEEKRELLQTMENRSKRECEKILATLSPSSMIPTERTRVISETQSEIRVVLTQAQVEKLERARCLLAHQNPDGSLAQLIELLADKVLDRVDPERKEARMQQRRLKAEEPPVAAPPVEPAGETSAKKRSPQPLAFKPLRKAIPAEIQRKVYLRDQGMCSYQNLQSGRRCCSRFLIQIDHRVAVAMNGSSELKNLRLLCFRHHKRETERIFGKWRIR